MYQNGLHLVHVNSLLASPLLKHGGPYVPPRPMSRACQIVTIIDTYGVHTLCYIQVCLYFPVALFPNMDLI